MATLKEILENAALDDNLPVKIGDLELPLGSLRQATTAQLTELTSRAKQLDEQERNLQGRQAKVIELSQKAQQAYDAAENLRKTASAAAAPGAGSDPFADPWLAPVRPELEKRDKEAAELKAKLEAANTMMTNMATTWAEDRWDKEYESLNWGERPQDKRPTRDELVQFAMQNNLLDRRKMPSIKLAWEKQNEQDRLSNMTKEAEERGRQKGREEALAARIPPPGVPGAAPMPKPANGGVDFQNTDLYAEAIKDPELRALIEQLPGGIA